MSKTSAIALGIAVVSLSCNFRDADEVLFAPAMPSSIVFCIIVRVRDLVGIVALLTSSVKVTPLRISFFREVQSSEAMFDASCGLDGGI